MGDDTTVRVIIEGINNASPAFQEAEKQATGFTQSIAKSVGVFAAAQMAGNFLAGAIDKLSNSLKSLTSGSLQMAGKFQEMEFSALALGRAMGLTEDTIRTSIADLNEAGIRYDVAAMSTATLARNQIDLAKSFDLARIAQATGVLLQEDSSATMEKLIMAATTGNTLMLRRMGIFVDMNKVMEQEAAAMGKSVEALTAREMAEIRVNAIIRESSAIMDVYGAAMESPTKAMRSLTGRLIPEMQAALGAAFLPAWKSVIDTMSSVVKWFTAALKEGGTLYPVMVQLGGVASYVADSFKQFVKSLLPATQQSENLIVSTREMGAQLEGMGVTAARAGSSFLTNLVNKLTTAATTALQGGIEISAGLAEGLVKGAASALTAAMDFIGGLLSSWLQPGSPPKVAADIVLWGAGTFTEYLKGFGEADFGILEDLQAPIKNVLGALVDAGTMGEDVASNLYKSLTTDITKALDDFRKTGTIDAGVFDKLIDIGGIYGPQLADLAKKQMDFATASIAAEQAQEALTRAMNKQDEANDKLNAVMEDFNQALRDGASPEILAQKRKAFVEAKNQAAQAKRDVKLAENANEAAKDKLDPLKKQVGLQEKLLQQLIDFTKVQATSAKLAKTPELVSKEAKGKGAGETISEMMGGITAADFDITSPLGDAIGNAKAMIAERFGDLFEPIRTAWENVQPTFESLGEKWKWFTGLVKEKWDEYVQPVIDALVGLIPPGLFDKFAIISGIVLVVAAAFGILSGVIAGVTAILSSPIAVILAIIAALTLLWVAWEEDWGGIRTYLTDLWTNTLQPIFQSLVDWFSINIPLAIETVKGYWENTLLPAITAVWAFLDEHVMPLFQSLVDFFNAAFTLAVTAAAGLWENVLQPAFEAVRKEIEEHLGPVIETVKENLGFFTAAWEVAKGVIENIKDAIFAPLGESLEKIGGFLDTIRGGLDSMTTSLRNVSLPSWLQPGSPTPFEEGLSGISKIATILVNTSLSKLDAMFGNLGTSVAKLKSTISAFVLALTEVAFEILEVLNTFSDSWYTAWEGIRTSTEETWNSMWIHIIEALSSAVSQIKLTLGELTSKWKEAFETMDGHTTTLKNDIKALYDKIKDSLLPIFEDLNTYIVETLGPSLQNFITYVLTPLKDGLDDVTYFAQVLLTVLEDIKNVLDDIDLPDWADPGSPPPLAYAFDDISNAVRQLAEVELPGLSSSMMNVGHGMQQIVTNGPTNNFNQTIYTNQGAQAVVMGYNEMMALVGA